MRNNNFEEDRKHFLGEAERLLQQEELFEALNLAERRLRLMPFDADAYVIAGSAFIGMGRINEAWDVLQEVEEIISEVSLVYERIGDTYRQKGFHQYAAACYEKFISLRPSAEKAREVIEKICLLEQLDQPAAEVDVSIPEPELFTVTLADLYINQGHLQEAERILKEIIKREPENIQAMAKLKTLNAASTQNKLSMSAKINESDNLIKILSSWLENIDRFKMHVAEK